MNFTACPEGDYPSLGECATGGTVRMSVGGSSSQVAPLVRGADGAARRPYISKA
jgi:hypothetical protein